MPHVLVLADRAASDPGPHMRLRRERARPRESTLVYHTKVLLYKGIIVEGIIHTKVLPDKGIVRN